MNPASYELAVTANLREVGLLMDCVGVLLRVGGLVTRLVPRFVSYMHAVNVG